MERFDERRDGDDFTQRHGVHPNPRGRGGRRLRGKAQPQTKGQAGSAPRLAQQHSKDHGERHDQQHVVEPEDHALFFVGLGSRSPRTLSPAPGAAAHQPIGLDRNAIQLVLERLSLRVDLTRIRIG